VVEGKIKSEGSVRIDGKLVGDIAVKANAAVGHSGVVEGTVQAKNVSLAGKLQGTVTATEKLILESNAVVRGDIRAARLVVDEGAMFDGQCNMTGPPAGGRSSRD
jgi:cytoskeletal protein CcmA (bactofilin family)